MTTSAAALPLKRVTLYKNNLAFYEKEALLSEGTLVDGSRNFSLEVPLSSKPLIVDTISVRAPGKVTIKYDTELRRDPKDQQDNEEVLFEFDRTSFPDFLRLISLDCYRQTAAILMI